VTNGRWRTWGQGGSPFPLWGGFRGFKQQGSSLERKLLLAGVSLFSKPLSPEEEGWLVTGSSIPQLASSLLSWQSLSPSHMKAGFVQMPVEHWNCPGRHLNSAGGEGRLHVRKAGGEQGMAASASLVVSEDPPVTRTLGTHDSLEAHLSGPRSHPLCHTSTRRGCTCRSCTQTGGQVGERGWWGS
jgi:hypothetical protein